MKALLSLSLILNFVLGFKLYVESKKPALERIIVEEKIVEREIPVPREVAPAVVDDKSNDATPVEAINMNEEEWKDELDKVENARRNFFEKEGIDPSILSKAKKLKRDFQKKQQLIYKGVYPGELPLEKRRQQIELEEQYNKDMQTLFGKRQWANFQAYKKRYNQILYKKMSTQDGTPRPFVPMDL